MNATPRTLNTDNFADTLANSATHVLVDFWAPWCGPCRIVGPVVEAIAAQYGDRLTVGKVNIDENGELASQFAVSAIPTLLIFHNGDIVDRLVGAVSEATLSERIDALLTARAI